MKLIKEIIQFEIDKKWTPDNPHFSFPEIEDLLVKKFKRISNTKKNQPKIDEIIRLMRSAGFKKPEKIEVIDSFTHEEILNYYLSILIKEFSIKIRDEAEGYYKGYIVSDIMKRVYIPPPPSKRVNDVSYYFAERFYYLINNYRHIGYENNHFIDDQLSEFQQEFETEENFKEMEKENRKKYNPNSPTKILNDLTIRFHKTSKELFKRKQTAILSSVLSLYFKDETGLEGIRARIRRKNV